MKFRLFQDTKLFLAVAALFVLSLVRLAEAADLNTNLLVNPGFENLGVLTEPQYDLSNILSWSGPGFAQAHGTSGWANDDPLATGETNYYAGGGHTMTQEVDLSSGDSAATIAVGRGEYDLSGWFTGFSTQADFGTLSVAFLAAGGNELGSDSISTPDTFNWTQNATSGDIPIGTDKARVTITSEGGGWADGYLDNVLFQVVEGDAPLGIDVNRTTGDITMENPNSGSSIEIDFYEIASVSGSLLASWNSFEDQGLDAIGGGVGQHWTQGAGVDSELLTEAFLLGASVFSANETQTLAGAFDTSNFTLDLEFRYGLSSEGILHTGTVTYDGELIVFELADLNKDGFINGADWTIYVAGLGADLSGLSAAAALAMGDLNEDGFNNHADYLIFKSEYEDANGPGSFAAMLAGVPEPGTLTLVIMGCLFLLRSRR